nr:hypothetical protein [Tanacetum cinerariifolium]
CIADVAALFQRSQSHIIKLSILVPAKSKSYYQAFNVKSLFGEIVSPKKSQVKLKCQTRLIIKITKNECLKPLQIKTTLHKKLSINQECQDLRSNPSKDRELDIEGKVRDLDIRGDFMSSDSHATITYTSMSSYEVIVKGYYEMPMDPLDPYVQLVMEAPLSPDYIPGPEAPPSPDYKPGPEALPSPDYIPGPEYPEYLPPADDPEMEPEEEDGDDEKSEEDSIKYPTSGGDDDADDDDDDLSKNDTDDEEEEESSDSEKEEEEHLALTIPAPALYSSISASEETEPFEEGETTATSPPFGLFSPTSYPLPPFLMPLPIFTLLPTSSFPLPSSLPSTSGSESIPEADIPLRERARFNTPTGGYEVGESSIAAAARHISPALTIVDRRRADDGLIGRLRRERRYFRTLSTTYAQEVAHSRDYCTQIMDYCQSREVHTSTLVTQIEALQRDVSTLQSQLSITGVAAAMTVAEASRVRNGYGSNGSGPRLAQVVREYPDSLKCQPLNFKGTDGGDRTHSVTVTLEVAQPLPWKTLKKMMTDKYCPRGEIKKLETEMWELKTKGTDVIGYSRRFQELALMYDRTFPKESDRVEKYIGGVPDTIHDSVKATKPKTMQEAIEFATKLMDKRIRDAVENKQKFECTSGNNQNQPQQNKRQNTGQAYAACNSDRNMYTGPKPLCSKCDYHHE